MAETISNSARVGKVKSILNLTSVGRIAGSGNNLSVVRSGNCNVIGMGSIKPKTAMSFIIPAPHLSGIKNRSSLIDIYRQLKNKRVRTRRLFYFLEVFTNGTRGTIAKKL